MEEASLDRVKGGSLIELIRFDKEVISPVRPDEPLMGGDRLVFSGQIDELLEVKESHSFVSADHHVFSTSEVDGRRQLRTAYINFGSSLISKTIASTSIERDNNITLVAVARRGERINQSPREVVLQAGDTLLLECPPKMRIDDSLLKRQLHFFYSGQIANISGKTLLSSLVMIAMVAVSALNILPLLPCALLAAFAMLLLRCCSPDQAMKAINWDILIVFAGSVALGLAIQKTGIAERMASGILDICGDSDPYVGICTRRLSFFRFHEDWHLDESDNTGSQHLYNQCCISSDKNLRIGFRLQGFYQPLATSVRNLIRMRRI